MSNTSFRFKQFSIRHDRCAMKVGTDGVLLGAWGLVEGKQILDIGTGTGLIALMAAQRNPKAEVLGIDIDEEAVQQAKENIAESPFCERVRCILADVMELRPTVQYDAILCNPPFFTEDTLPEDKGRALARNNKSMPFAKLIPKVATLLSETGTFSIIIPYEHVQEVVGLGLAEGLYLQRRCLVHTTAKKPPRRALLTFSKKHGTCLEQELCLNANYGSRSQAYSELTRDFYL
jgi:tRNA1Val (adenine37-N6)-methyltransferase